MTFPDTFGGLELSPALEHPNLLADPVAAGLRALPEAAAARFAVAAIDPDLADTAALTEHYGLSLEVSANCVVVAGKREGERRFAACLILANTRADVNGVVKRRLDVRKASFAPQQDAVDLAGMEYGGITAVGLPAEWPLLIDSAVVAADWVIIGSGLRRSKLVVPGSVLPELPHVEVTPGLGRPTG
ncbi:prolyl-tRNA editing enzyme YbaK/EbsC (Cys-tRNA(Pro) deacylase) [Actinoalloteichus hoggarensis]|uniref:YbaK / prolyl-tRNA synthetases associated domain protein n=1 Tax=Actinoalloteichus hoggarensis TaxID=1470176 RepID=A0A221VX55_9PSEU|nr:YbaK/EbsC family protein [Actinoalloteichus hoggarensis]ASO18083.1 YbaK / prolyl-tRNA synthetases associated domain protein [Actinoalloteichus hoggarensis]MBB5921440.1 prolyl-tRNA editing enzyme YbaK/EbsC (Cys-tRNA(Pro) deacylase) [Actinoalloteichus hoggarensis]